MNRLRQSIILLAILMTLLINIERLRVDRTNPLDFVSFLSLFALLGIYLIAKLPILSRGSAVLPVALGVGAYLLCRYLLFSDPRGLSSGEGDIAIALLQVVVVAGLVLVARDVVNRLSHLEQTLVDLTISGEGRPVTRLEDAGESVRAELRRCLRYERPLSLIVVEPGVGTAPERLPRIREDLLAALSHQLMLARLGRTIGEVVRHSDTVLVQDAGRRFIVLCPETDRASAQALVQRIRSATGDRLGIAVACGDAVLPKYQVTFEELVLQAENELRSTRLTDEVKARVPGRV